MSTNHFHISSDDTVAEIKNRFSHICPKFEINFFTKNEGLKTNNSCAMYSSEVRIGDINHQSQDGWIELNDQMKLEEIERLIHDLFKLNPQVRPVKHEGGIPFAFKDSTRENYYGGTPVRARRKMIYLKDLLWGF